MNETLSSQQHTTIIWTVQQQQQEINICEQKNQDTRKYQKHSTIPLSRERVMCSAAYLIPPSNCLSSRSQPAGERCAQNAFECVALPSFQQGRACAMLRSGQLPLRRLR